MSELQLIILVVWIVSAIVTFKMSMSASPWDIGEAIFLALFFPLIGPAAYIIWLLRVR